MTGKPTIPARRELLCHYCRKHRPREMIVEAKHIRDEKQTVYRCRPCADRLRNDGAGGK